jgi:hypothetical protein
MSNFETIPSNELVRSRQEKPFETGEPYKLEIGDWNMQFAPNTIRLSETHQKQIGQYTLTALSCFFELCQAREETLAMTTVNQPTALARVDCTLDDDGNIFAYEVEERPSGLGITRLVSDKLSDGNFSTSVLGHLEDTFGTLPIVKRHPEARSDDEYLFGESQVSPLEFDERTGAVIVANQPQLVRSEPEKVIDAPNAAELSSQAISTVIEKGNKLYRVATGAARIVHGAEELPPKDTSFVVKTLQSSKTKGTEIWVTKEDNQALGLGKKNIGVSTWSKIERIAEGNDTVLVEPLIPGVRSKTTDKIGMTAFRVFVTIYEDHVQVQDGVYMTRPSHMIHGASDAITGLVTSPEKVEVYANE